MQKSIQNRHLDKEESKKIQKDTSSNNLSYSEYIDNYNSWRSLKSRYIRGLSNINKSKFFYHTIPLLPIFMLPILSTNLIIMVPGLAMLYIMYISDNTNLSIFESVNISLLSGLFYYFSLITFVSSTSSVLSLVLGLSITLLYILYCIFYVNTVYEHSK